MEEAALKAPLLVALDDLQWGTRARWRRGGWLPAQLADLPIAWLVASRVQEGSDE